MHDTDRRSYEPHNRLHAACLFGNVSWGGWQRLNAAETLRHRHASDGNLVVIPVTTNVLCGDSNMPLMIENSSGGA